MIATAGLAPLGFRPVAPRTAPLRHPRIGSIARGAVELLLWVALAGGVGTVAAGVGGYLKGRIDGATVAEGKAADERADLERRHRVETDKLRADAQARFDAAAAEAAQRFDRIDTARKEAQRALADEQATTRRLRGDLDAGRERDRLRNLALARAATGGVTEAEDTIAACRARADGLGRALDDVLPRYRTCSLDLEDASGSTRSLLRWADAFEASERAEVTP